MRTASVPDDLWEIIQPLLPAAAPQPKGRPPMRPDRLVLAGVLQVLHSGIPWWLLAAELGCGSGVTCWRRLRDWQAAGVFQRLRQALLDRLGQAGAIDWSRAGVGSISVSAKRGGAGRRHSG